MSKNSRICVFCKKKVTFFQDGGGRSESSEIVYYAARGRKGTLLTSVSCQQ